MKAFLSIGERVGSRALWGEAVVKDCIFILKCIHFTYICMWIKFLNLPSHTFAHCLCSPPHTHTHPLQPSKKVSPPVGESTIKSVNFSWGRTRPLPHVSRLSKASHHKEYAPKASSYTRDIFIADFSSPSLWLLNTMS